MYKYKTNSKSNRGRPKIEIDWVQFDKLCFLQCTQLEIASFFSCTIETLENRCKAEKGMNYLEYYKTKAVNGKISLRRKAFQLIEKGNPSVIIFALKNMVGWTDKMVSEFKGEISESAPVVNFITKSQNDKKNDKKPK
jgi:hypothetical protein